MKRQRTSNLLQQATLGKNCPEDVYNAQLRALYSRFNGHLLDDEMDLCQTYEDFILAGQIGHTNEDGTGRFNLEPNRSVIGILPLFTTKSTVHMEEMINSLLLLIPAYFPTMRGELCVEKLVMKNKGKSIVDAEQGVEFPIKTNKHKQLDAFAVLDVVEEYVKSHMFHIIAITDLPLFDPEADGDAIFGRANGNRTCVVHYEPRKEKLCINTCLHESLHCMGFDHCSAWRCIMNPCLEDGDEEVEFTLCPAELRKLMSMQNKVSVKQRFEALLHVFQQLGAAGYEAEIGWLERMLLQLQAFS